MNSSGGALETRHSIPVVDWRSGRIRFDLPHESGSAPTWSLVICGDWAPQARFFTRVPNNPLDVYGDLLPVLQEADLAAVNLECVIADGELARAVKDGIHLRLPSKAIEALSDVPFHLACLANNHTLDYGVGGLTKTLRFLEDHDIRSVGAGLTARHGEKAAEFEFGGKRLAIVNVAEGEEAQSADGGPGVAALDAYGLRHQLTELRSVSDVVVVIVHAGREHLPVPAPHIKEKYRSLVDAGADLVVGHHPHVPQGLEIYEGTPIAYSLGNFAFWSSGYGRYRRLGYVVRARFCGSHLEELRILPYSIGAHGLQRLKGKSLADFLRDLEALSGIIKDETMLAEVWDAYADQWLLTKGLLDIADTMAMVGGSTLVCQSILRASLYRFGSDRFINGLARRGLWRAIHWLGRHGLDLNMQEGSLGLAQTKRGAAILRNRFDTSSHRELYLAALGRVMDGSSGKAPDWAIQLLTDWEAF